MYRFIDKLLLRFDEALLAFRNPMHSYEQFQRGKEAGKAIAFAQVVQQFNTHDVYQFSNQHFKLGYYYATEQAKQVMNLDENHTMA